MSIIQRIPVGLKERSYDIIAGAGILSQLPTYLNELSLGKTVAIVTHPDLYERYGKSLEDTLSKAGYSVHVLQVPNGESSKSLSTVNELLDQLFPLRLERKDTIVALGGGVIGDLAGFLASIYLRGIPVVQIPTTLLAQVDACIGGKTGVNHAYGKNLIGSFHQPKLVLEDIQTLTTLPIRERRAGLAEVVKYGMIWDASFFSYIEDHADALIADSLSSHMDIWQFIVHSSASIKANVVAQDEQEKNLRAILNYGHTIAHGIEAVYAYNTYLHGESVAIGMVGASKLSCLLGLNSDDAHQRLVTLLTRLGFDLTLQSGPTPDDIYEKMKSDKKVHDGTLRFILNKGIGRVVIQDVTDVPTIKGVISDLF